MPVWVTPNLYQVPEESSDPEADFLLDPPDTGPPDAIVGVTVTEIVKLFNSSISPLSRFLRIGTKLMTINGSWSNSFITAFTAMPDRRLPSSPVITGSFSLTYISSVSVASTCPGAEAGILVEKTG